MRPGSPPDSDGPPPEPAGDDDGTARPSPAPPPGEANLESPRLRGGRAAFDSARLRQDLRGRAVRGGAATIVGQGVKFALIFGSTLILARLLTPDDFGLVGMIHPVTAFVWLMRDLGLSTAAVQRESLEDRQVNALFWINVFVSVLLGVLVAAASPAIAAFYGDERLVWIAVAMAGTMVMGGVAAQHQALLRREMRFLEISVIEVGGLALGFGCAVAAAMAGLGYWALVINIAVREAAISAALMIRSGWRPSMPGQLGSATEMIRFGWYLALAKLLEFSTRNTDTVLIGRMWGSGPLGLYNVAYRLLLLPIQQINGPLGIVAVPVLSRLQSEPDRYRRFYRQGMLLLASASMPVVLLTAATADRMVRVLAGPQWTEATPVFLALAPAAWIASFNAADTWVYVSRGLGRRQFVSKLITVPVVIAGIVIGVQESPVGAAIGLSIATVLVRPFAVWWCFRGTPVRVADLVWAIARPTTAGAVAGGVAWWVSRSIGAADSSVLALVGLVAAFGVVYAGTWIVLPGGRQRLAECLSMVQDVRRRRGGADTGPDVG